jgi:hypothetical protein
LLGIIIQHVTVGFLGLQGAMLPDNVISNLFEIPAITYCESIHTVV